MCMQCMCMQVRSFQLTQWTHTGGYLCCCGWHHHWYALERDPQYPLPSNAPGKGTLVIWCSVASTSPSPLTNFMDTQTQSLWIGLQLMCIGMSHLWGGGVNVRVHSIWGRILQTEVYLLTELMSFSWLHLGSIISWELHSGFWPYPAQWHSSADLWDNTV